MTFKKACIVTSHYLLSATLSTIIWLCLGALLNTIDRDTMPGAPVGFFWNLAYLVVLVGTFWFWITFKYAFNPLDNLLVFYGGLLLAAVVYVVVVYGLAAGAGALVLCLFGVAVMLPGALMICSALYLMGVR